MKIDEACIDHNIVDSIRGLCLSDLYTIHEGHAAESDSWLAYIDGMVQLGDRLKEVLKK